MCLIIDKKKDYYRACKGFYINGIKYRRLLGTNGGIKNSTIVFVSERLVAELRRRIENGRDPSVELVTAKLEAYKALTCSASNPVSMPQGILVVNDAETEFYSDIISLTDEDGGEPIMEYRHNELISMNASDGFGLMLPSLAKRWSEELDLGYDMSGANTRFSWEKGMVFTFDYIEFAERVAGTYFVKDAWGNTVDVRDTEIVLTTSMVKLWDSYPDCEDYVSRSIENGYTFGISKTCPEELESERNLNYQFIQSLPLSDEDIKELVSPTMNEIRAVLGGDWRKTVLFLKGSGMNERNVHRLEDNFIKAVMIDERVLNDPFVLNNIYQLICNRINEAKVGVLKVHGNYSVIGGDPYLLCQSFFGLPKTGLLKAGEIYNEYWANIGSEKLACFRAPMTCRENIRAVRPADNDEVRYWYRHIHTATVFNGWDTAPAALNGCDFDGDIVMLTDNPVLVRHLIPLPALMCAQRKAKKTISDEDDFIQSNIASFGNEIGQTTNKVTSMFEVRSRYSENSEEYKVLSYRIRCGQLYQQNAIDKAKGIICMPMPKTWYDRHAVAKIEDNDKRDLYRRISAEKKPYFMRYIYPSLMKKYNQYIKNTNRNCMREFQMSVSELKEIPYSDLTERQKEFLHYYDYYMPVGTGDCIMNKICRMFEEAFDGYVSKQSATHPFDYKIMKSAAEYSSSQMSRIKGLYEDYNRRLSNYSVFMEYERVDEYDSYNEYMTMNDDFRRACSEVCQDRFALCNMLLDMCYTRSSAKRFVWSMCGEEIIKTLLVKNGNKLSFPIKDEDGDIEYCGVKFMIKTIEVTE